MIQQLGEIELRILGSLVEKSLTTPEAYPLSLNTLVNACNQKTSRDPVMSLDEAAVSKSLFGLLQKELAERVAEPGSRVPKFRHRVDRLLNSEDPKLVGTICVLMLRGPQTPGEIKSRTDRLCIFTSTAEVEGLLQDLSTRADGAMVERLPRQPGQKETRYRHFFSGEAATAAAVSASPTAPNGSAAVPLEQRITALEERVSALEARLSRPEQI